MPEKLRAAVVGCGLIGERRARVATQHPASTCPLVADVDIEVAKRVAASVGARATADWRDAILDPGIDAVVVSTPNGFLGEIACAALRAGKHVLVEKPMGRNVAEAVAMANAARDANRVLKVGFNHRYHPAIAEAWRRVQAGEIGAIINARCRYGHGGRPGYEREWRGSRDAAGGGELTDQGVHVLDLFHWFLGVPSRAYAVRQTAVWPLGDLEDNGAAILEYAHGPVALLHTSWTQWKNLFSLELFGDAGALVVEGLGRSYGVETLTRHLRVPQGGAPRTERWTFDAPDDSWSLEWDVFVRAASAGEPLSPTPEDGVAVMTVLDALYRSASLGHPVQVAVSEAAAAG